MGVKEAGIQFIKTTLGLSTILHRYSYTTKPLFTVTTLGFDSHKLGRLDDLVKYFLDYKLNSRMKLSHAEAEERVSKAGRALVLPTSDSGSTRTAQIVVARDHSKHCQE